MRIIFAGSGEFGLPTLRRLTEGDEEIVQVISQPDRPSGRGRKLTPTAISQVAMEKKLNLLRTENANAESLAAADVMVVIAFGQKMSAEIVARPKFGSVNLHASLLPKYRGAAPIHWAILRGEKETGNSVIRLAQRMDAGAILGQSRLTIGEAETTGELHDRLAVDGAELMGRVLGELAAGKAMEREQDESQATAAPKLGREETRIDWHEDAERVARRICAMSPWPGCRVKLMDAARNELGMVTLLKARAIEGEGSRWNAGEICGDGRVSCGDGAKAVDILRIQPAGGRAMTVEDYRRGHAWCAGMMIESIV
ncbi:MAG TPA: methionyl-tRNA formyltransferase [Tepidisphaeraceae bacterium]|nr:methionyl-tRNA formyltransferase [Tepidisphaeraceae bacterium]